MGKSSEVMNPTNEHLGKDCPSFDKKNLWRFQPQSFDNNKQNLNATQDLNVVRQAISEEFEKRFFKENYMINIV